MNDDQTKFLLGAFRPGRDTADPAFAGALEQMTHDPKLRAWFERDQAFGTAIAGKLREVAPPAGLREAILAGGKLGARTPWWRRPALLAAAAAIVMLLSLAPIAVRMTRPAAATNLSEFAMAFAGRGFIGLQQRDTDVEKLKAWLANRHAPLPTEIPWELAQLRGLGCRTVDFKGKTVSMLCFEQGHEYHLFVAWREDFPDLPGSIEPHFQTGRGSWAAAAWSDKQYHYVLVSDAGEAAVKRLL
jgi:anti-sigma factor RsiW